MPLPAMVFRLDPELLFAPVPKRAASAAARAGAGGAWITTELESHGFRGRELADPKRGPRVLVVGDSLVMAQTSPLEETYCASSMQRSGGRRRSSTPASRATGPTRPACAWSSCSCRSHPSWSCS
jgi:hypothetical protein